jgi:hypothetical protein
MPAPTNPSRELTHAQQEAWDAVQEHGTIRAAARALGKNYTPVHACYTIAKRKMNLDPFITNRLSQLGVNELGGAHSAWIELKDDEGKKTGNLYVQFPKDNADDDALERIAAAFDVIQPAPPIIQSEKGAAGKVAFFPHSDVHIGVDIDADRGGRDYTPEIAMQRMRDGFAECHGAIQPCETAIVLNNGDLTHANDDRDVTVKSQHRLKVRGSHRQNLNLAVTATVWQIDMALTRHERVIYRPNRGNHDPNTPDTLTIALRAYYAQNPRVTIDQSEREIWVWQRGLLFLSAWHGDKRRPEDVCKDMPGNFPDQFGKSRFWYGFTGHYHGPKQGVHGPIHWWQLPSVCSMDQHSADANFTDDAAMRAMLFCERGGLKNDFTTRF